MKVLFVVFVSLLLTSSLGSAQQLALRSGDHEGFSRITIPLTSGQKWSARQTSDSILVSLPGFSGTFEMNDIFFRMQRTRITRVDQIRDQLRLKIECNCISTAFLSGQLLVIDVADPGTVLIAPPMPGSPKNTASLTKRTSGDRSNAARLLPWIGSDSPFRSQEAPADAHILEMTGEEFHIKRVDLLEETQRNLAQRVANAATVGLLNKNIDNAKISKDQDLRGNDPIRPTSEQIPPLNLDTSDNMRITSSMDRPSTSNWRSVDSAVSVSNCPKTEILPIEAWGNETRFTVQIGKAREALVNARDKLDPIKVKELAQTYIYFGFGAEALASLRMDPSLIEKHPELAAVARILERGSLQEPSILRPFTGCSTNIALWAVVSADKIPAHVYIDTDATLLALNKLPQHLRQIVAPMVSERLLDYGDKSSAEAAMRSIGRLPTAALPTAQLALADITVKNGESAEVALRNIIDMNTEQSPHALIKLVEQKLAKGDTVSLELSTLVESYVQEFRGTRLGNDLQKIELYSLSLAGRFTEAFTSLDKLASTISNDEVHDVRDVLFAQLSKKASDSEFLEYVFLQQSPMLNDLSVDTKLLISQRLIDLGFAAKSQEILAAFPDKPRIEKRQILTARAALQLQQPFQAQAALIGITGAEAELLMARSKAMTGDFREATQLFSKNQANVEAQESAWLSDDWKDLVSAETPNFMEAATLVKRSETTSSLGPINQANNALAESQAARETLNNLLKDPTLKLP